MSKRALRAYSQFCYRCGCLFLRYDRSYNAPVLCGLCLNAAALAAPNLTEAQRDFAEHELARWLARQEAIGCMAEAETVPGAVSLPRRFAECDDEAPF